MTKPEKKFRTAFDRKSVSLSFEGTTSLTKQADKDACDINLIVKKFQSTGLLPNTASGEPFYADLSNSLDYQSALNTVINAQNTFQQLPSQIRNQFQNDPYQFLAFCENPDNQVKLVEMGLANPIPKVDSPTPPEKPTTPNPEA